MASFASSATTGGARKPPGPKEILQGLGVAQAAVTDCRQNVLLHYKNGL